MFGTIGKILIGKFNSGREDYIDKILKIDNEVFLNIFKPEFRSIAINTNLKNIRQYITLLETSTKCLSNNEILHPIIFSEESMPINNFFIEDGFFITEIEDIIERFKTIGYDFLIEYYELIKYDKEIGVRYRNITLVKPLYENLCSLIDTMLEVQDIWKKIM